MIFAYSNIQSEDRVLIRLLFETDRLDIYDLHSKYKLSPGQIARLLEKFSKDNLIRIEEKDDSIFLNLTADGRSWILKNDGWLLFGNRRLAWKEIPNIFLRDEKNKSKPYLPSSREIERTYFGRFRGISAKR